MTTYQYHQLLFDILREQLSLCVLELTPVLDVPEGAVRNDLMRGYGGYVLNQQDQFQDNSLIRRYRQNAAARLAIAWEATAWVSGKDASLWDAGGMVCPFAELQHETCGFSVQSSSRLPWGV